MGRSGTGLLGLAASIPGETALAHGRHLRQRERDVPLVDPVGRRAPRLISVLGDGSSGHMMTDGVTPKRRVAAAQLFRAVQDRGPGGSSKAGAGGNIDHRRGGRRGEQTPSQATGARASSPRCRRVW